MTRQEKRAFAKAVRMELDGGIEENGIVVLRRIAKTSKDIRARLSCIRMLAAEVAANEPKAPVYDAKWKVKKVAPK